MDILFKPIWFDSLGAKSSCTLVRTGSHSILIDPGVAIMHGGFPAPHEAKYRWYQEAYQEILKASREADIIVITHYHYDHFIDFERTIYYNKTILAKDPNMFINDSQRKRALAFYEHLYGVYGIRLSEVMEAPRRIENIDPFSGITQALSKDFGDYNNRRKMLISKGIEWFKRRLSKWKHYRVIPELKASSIEVRFADGRTFTFGKLRLRFTRPLFHGIEFSRLGWIIGLTIEYNGWKLLYSSDVNGPIIEDYASWIISEDPDIIILDGPMTYMLGYTLNKINLRRALDNAIRIIRETNASLILYDHHLPRDPKFKERTKVVWEEARTRGIKLMTVAEYLGLMPAVLRYKT